MSSPIPMPLRAAAGLAALAVDEARRLPGRLVNLPVLAVGTALSVSLKAQQRYTELVTRGDQLLGQLRGQQDGTPPWARFDDEDPDLAGLPDEADERLVEAMAAAVDEDVVDEDVVDGTGLGPPDAVAATAPDGPDVLTVAELDGVGGLIEAVPDEPAGPALDGAGPGSAETEIGTLADDASRYDGYLSQAPLPGYDEMSIPQLRARLRTLTERQLTELIGYERATAERPAYLTMLENRLSTVRGR